MKEDSEEVKQLKRQIAALESQLKYQCRVIDVLVAVGTIPQRKLEQAREIVSGLSD